MYAEDCDFITEIDKKTGKIYQLAKDVMTDINLIATDNPTKPTTVKRGTRNVITLGSKLGDREDIKRRKGQATILLSKNATIWKDKWKIKQKTRIQLYKTMVKSILLCNCRTWGLSHNDQQKLNSFHRKQLRRVNWHSMA